MDRQWTYKVFRLQRFIMLRVPLRYEVSPRAVVWCGVQVRGRLQLRLQQVRPQHGALLCVRQEGPPVLQAQPQRSAQAQLLELWGPTLG